MLKTPRFPVWVCCINSCFSVLFSLNRSLLSDWKRENQFQVFYYNGQNSQRSTARLTIGEPVSLVQVQPEPELQHLFCSLQILSLTSGRLRPQTQSKTRRKGSLLWR